ncbi:MAG: ribosome biogenesis GTP-binding protein YihA/YsxC [Pseudomonadota bacterium]
MTQFSQASFLTSAHERRQFVDDEGVEVAFAGRSNAGKSSALNTIVGRKQFARISKTPGRTQLVNFFNVGIDQRLVDLPGYGFAKVSKQMRQHWKLLMESYFSERASLQGLFLVVDIRRGMGEFDQQMLQYAESLTVQTHVLLTKADKLKRGPASAQLLQTRRQLGERATVQLFSSLKRTGAGDAREVLTGWLNAKTAG